MLGQFLRLIAVVAALAPSLASAENYGDWFSGKETGTGLPFIATINDSDGIFGKWCDAESEKCFWLLALKTRCDASAQFPALISSPDGVVSVTLICGGPRVIGKETYYRLFIQEFEMMTKITRQGKGKLGIAIALDDGAFKVNRFSLVGGSAALAHQELAEAEYVRVKSKSTRDTTL